MNAFGSLPAVLLVPWLAQAQTPEYHLLYSFPVGQGAPQASLTEGPDSSLYGATTGGAGAIFRITQAGDLTVLATFNGTNGQTPATGLTLAGDGNFYGTTVQGGLGARGTVFRVTPNGELTTLVHFDDTNGAFPAGKLALGPSGDLYGSTVTGTNYTGTIFKLTTAGAFETLLNLPADYASFPAGLTLGPDGNLYGLTYQGVSAVGLIFRVTPDGVPTRLVTVLGSNRPFSTSLTVGPDNHFYGAAIEGGPGRRGSVFRVTRDGLLTTLFEFQGLDGVTPADGLTLGEDGNFYGTTGNGGTNGLGTIYRISPEGSFASLLHFNDTNGSRPYASLTRVSDGSLYGTTVTGGSHSSGTIFRLDFAPFLSSQPVSRTNETGTTARFAVNAGGTKPLGYQWFKDGQSLADGDRISGATSNELILADVEPADSGELIVKVSNRLGTATSAAASLTIISPNPDTDHDGVPDALDDCPGTVPGAIVDGAGCSIDQLVPRDGRWKNHGVYVSAVVAAVQRFVVEGWMNQQEASRVIAVAARSR